jgi:iron-sulfur cluster repair protein YtfE (RIC family)
MNDPLTILRSDHREVSKMLNALAETDEGKEREQLLADVQAALTLHMQIEEELLNPLVQEHVGAEDEEEAEIEHGLAREGLQKAVELVAAPGFGAVVEMLKAGIKHHVDEEEREILPELKSAMERDDWRSLGDAIAKMKADAGDAREAKPTRRSGRRASSKRKS